MAVPNTRNRTVSNNIEDLLKEISDKLSLLIEKIDSNHEPLKLILDNFHQHFGNIKSNHQEINDLGMGSTANNMQLEKEISLKKNVIIRTWKRNLNERKQAFWNALKTENTVDIYKKWRRLDKTIMPRKFRIKEIAGEDETERAIRENLALQKFDAEIALLETRSTKYTTRFQNIDMEMEEEINKVSTGEIQSHLLEKWKSDTDNDEEKSKYIWTKKKLFYDNYEENYGTIDLDRNHTHRGNKRNKRRNNRTYADVARPEIAEHANHGNPMLRSSVNAQRQRRNHNRWDRGQTSTADTGIVHHEGFPSERQANHKWKNNNYENNNHNHANNNHGKPFLWRGKIQKYRWKNWA
jgi:hypothetical protein